MSKAQLNRDKKVILRILADGKKKSFSQISLQGGEGLWPALRELILNHKVEEAVGAYYKSN